MLEDWRYMTHEDVPNRHDIEESIILCISRGIGNSDQMRSQWLRERRLIRTGGEGDIETPIGKFTNEHAWVLGDLNIRKVIAKLSPKEYKPYGMPIAAERELARASEAESESDVSPDVDVPLPTETAPSRQQTVTRPAREGQDAFRAELMRAYEGCAVTQCGEEAALQAAHIIPYVNQRSNSIVNGLCLRVDLHFLFDRGLIEIDHNYQVKVSERVIEPMYCALGGVKIKKAEAGN